MAVPSTQELLAAWERGQAAPRSAERAIALLGAASADGPTTPLATLAIGARDQRLLSLRRDMFGPQLMAGTTCPECGTSLELELDIDDFRVAGESDGAADAGERLSFSQADYEIVYRLPDSADLLALCEEESDDSNRLRLLQRIVLHSSCSGQHIETSGLPAALLDAFDAHLAHVDPHGDIRLNLSCAACTKRWQATFDIASYLWSEVDGWALRLLRDVHRLARAYGWREADILALSASRRQCYLGMLDE